MICDPTIGAPVRFKIAILTTLIVKHMNNWGMSGYSISARIIHRGIQVTKNSKAISSKDYRNNDECFEVSGNNKTN